MSYPNMGIWPALGLGQSCAFARFFFHMAFLQKTPNPLQKKQKQFTSPCTIKQKHLIVQRSIDEFGLGGDAFYDKMPCLKLARSHERPDRISSQETNTFPSKLSDLLGPC